MSCSFSQPLVNMLDKQQCFTHRSQTGAHSILSCSCIHSMYQMMIRLHQLQIKSTLRTSLSGGARLALPMLAQVLIVVAVIVDPEQHSWPAVWTATRDCSGTSAESTYNNVQTITFHQTVATVATVTHRFSERLRAVSRHAAFRPLQWH